MNIRFLGSGNAFNRDLGDSSAVFEVNGEPVLMIDCGQSAYNGYIEQYKELPNSIFITHTHNDHISGLENLFFTAMFNDRLAGKIKLFIPAGIIKDLYENVANYESILAEGGANFADCFQIIPILNSFWLTGYKFDIFQVRHMSPGRAFGISLRGCFFYSGDTRPIPEIVGHYATSGEIIFHDCSLGMNPAHSDIESIKREYTMEQIRRMVFYHLPNIEQVKILEGDGFRVAKKGGVYSLNSQIQYIDYKIMGGYVVGLGSNSPDRLKNLDIAISQIARSFENVTASKIQTTESDEGGDEIAYANCVVYFESNNNEEIIIRELDKIKLSGGGGGISVRSKGDSNEKKVQLYYQVLCNIKKGADEINMDIIETNDVPFLRKILHELMFKLGYKKDGFFGKWIK